jgi:hypothetical protein
LSYSGVYDQCLGEGSAEVPPVIDADRPIVKQPVGLFKGNGIEPVLLGEEDACGVGLFLGGFEEAVIEFERTEAVCQNFRNDARVKVADGAQLALLAEGEDVAFGGVAVEVEEEGDFVFATDTRDEGVGELNFGEKFEVAVLKVAVEVLPQHASPVVAQEDPVWVDHGQDEEDVVIGQDGGIQYFGNEGLEGPVGDGFSGMCPSHDNHGFPSDSP